MEGNIANVGDLAKPVNTLIKKISDAIGVLFEPQRIIRRAKAETQAEEIKAISDLKIDELKKRTLARMINEETKKQENIENIIDNSLPLLNEQSKPIDIDNDWLANFFDKARITSNEQMQTIWSKILAGEANKPGTFTRRTIKIVSELEIRDAMLFTNLAKFNFLIGLPTIVIFDCQNDIYNKYGITFNTLKHLDTLGLISFESISGYGRQKLPQDFTISYFHIPIKIRMQNEKDNTLPIGQVLLTQSGQELVQICGSTPEREIIDYSIEQWKNQGVRIN
ncbi:MAG: DUF2806 domain-containing protein [Nitrospirota bacterium]